MKSPVLHLFAFCVLSYQCVYSQRSLNIQIDPIFLGKPLVLGAPKYQGPQGDTLQIDRLRFYLSSMILTTDNGKTYVEQNSFHLIDAEEPATLRFNIKNVPDGKIVSMAFNIGIDSLTSVSGAMGGDLDPAKGMYWAWNSGYINAKLEGHIKTLNGKKSEPFEFHIGGYMQPYYAIRTVKIDVTEKSANAITLQPDIAAWFTGWDKQKEKSIMIPGSAAMVVADRYAKMFNAPN